jgi:hypothetical protein
MLGFTVGRFRKRAAAVFPWRHRPANLSEYDTAMEAESFD